VGYEKLFDFDGDKGANPFGSLILSGSIFYGMTGSGGTNDMGTIFKVNTDGSVPEVLLSFDGSNGYSPSGSPILSGGVLYGMTVGDNLNNRGTIFKINIDGSGHETILEFDGITNGANPSGDLIISGGTLYGMTSAGGTNEKGTIFKINTDGSGYETILDFDGITNGSTPVDNLILSGGTLYGTTSGDGAYGLGTIFKINTDGSGYETILDFDGVTNGGNPQGSLILSGNTLYGTTAGGFGNNLGTIFKINTDGSGYETILDFDGVANGSYPVDNLILSGSTLYGMTTYDNGVIDLGTIFKINTDKTGYETIFSFNGLNSGSNPYGGLILSENTLYGMTHYGGTNNKGTIFKFGL
jgi:uncharacterized repeat protein (TIGR03803 family)